MSASISATEKADEVQLCAQALQLQVDQRNYVRKGMSPDDCARARNRLLQRIACISAAVADLRLLAAAERGRAGA